MSIIFSDEYNNSRFILEFNNSEVSNSTLRTQSLESKSSTISENMALGNPYVVLPLSFKEGSTDFIP